MVLIDTKRRDVEKDDNGKVKAYTLSVMMLEPVAESNQYYIKRNIQWRIESGYPVTKIPSNFGLKNSNDNTDMLVKYLFGKINELKDGEEAKRIECLSEKVSVEYTPNVDEYFATANHIYLNLTEAYNIIKH